MDVKVEGFNVCRHMDLMTHNHASLPCNTGTWQYIDEKVEMECGEHNDEINKKCHKNEHVRRARNVKKRNIDRKIQAYEKGSDGLWKRENCQGLNFNPPSPKEFRTKGKQITDMKDISKEIQRQLQEMHDRLKEAYDTRIERIRERISKLDKKVQKAVVKRIKKVISRTAIRAWLGPVGWLWAGYDLLSGAIEFAELYNKISEMRQDLDDLIKFKNKINTNLTQKGIADLQAGLAKTNPCLKARKCMLVEYDTDSDSNIGSHNKKNTGCCFGQTAHHVIPGSMFTNPYDCKDYKYGKAPCVCVEGTGHSLGGSHQNIHHKFRDVFKQKIQLLGNKRGTISYELARDIALDSFEEIFPQCKRACIAAQLDNYHLNTAKCSSEKSELKAVDGISDEVYRDSGSSKIPPKFTKKDNNLGYSTTTITPAKKKIPINTTPPPQKIDRSIKKLTAPDGRDVQIRYKTSSYKKD